MIGAFILPVLAGLTLFLDGAANDTNPLTLKVSQNQLTPPAAIRIKTRVEPHEENRSICIFMANRQGTYETSACRDTGTPTMEWPSCVAGAVCRPYWVPAGDYEVTAVLQRISGVIRTSVKFTVQGDDPPPSFEGF